HSAGSGSGFSTALAFWVGGLVVGAATVAWLSALGPGESTICLVRNWTGVPCPGCGVTRAIEAMLRGSYAEAFTLHPLAPFAVTEAVVVWVAWGVSLARFRRGLDERRLALLLLANLVAFVALWIVRAVTGTLPG
ncbi:MAG: DUF2752 domain-containing protein, partial [Thermoanaerobaculia bacterium]|nr:DUF2752 domain-containing protein [Thermoanaerobaculia bacterium]